MEKRPPGRREGFSPQFGAVECSFQQGPRSMSWWWKHGSQKFLSDLSVHVQENMCLLRAELLSFLILFFFFFPFLTALWSVEFLGQGSDPVLQAVPDP